MGRTKDTREKVHEGPRIARSPADLYSQLIPGIYDETLARETLHQRGLHGEYIYIYEFQNGGGNRELSARDFHALLHVGRYEFQGMNLNQLRNLRRCCHGSIGHMIAERLGSRGNLVRVGLVEPVNSLNKRKLVLTERALTGSYIAIKMKDCPSEE